MASSYAQGYGVRTFSWVAPLPPVPMSQAADASPQRHRGLERHAKDRLGAMPSARSLTTLNLLDKVGHEARTAPRRLSVDPPAQLRRRDKKRLVNLLIDIEAPEVATKIEAISTAALEAYQANDFRPVKLTEVIGSTEF